MPEYYIMVLCDGQCCRNMSVLALVEVIDEIYLSAPPPGEVEIAE
jgi:hypothetical protein